MANAGQILLAMGFVVACFFIALSRSGEFGLLGLLFFIALYAGPLLLAGGALYVIGRRRDASRETRR